MAGKWIDVVAWFLPIFFSRFLCYFFHFLVISFGWFCECLSVCETILFCKFICFRFHFDFFPVTLFWFHSSFMRLPFFVSLLLDDMMRPNKPKRVKLNERKFKLCDCDFYFHFLPSDCVRSLVCANYAHFRLYHNFIAQ